jgi:hypothetical protein
MKSMLIAASLLAASCALSALNAAPPATTNPTTAPAANVQADKEWKLPDGTFVKQVVPAGDVVFIRWAVDLSTPGRGASSDEFFKLDIKAGSCTSAADLIPDPKTEVKMVVVSPDAKHAAMFARPAAPPPDGQAHSPAGPERLYLLDVEKEKAVAVEGYAREDRDGGRECRVTWRNNGSFFVSYAAGDRDGMRLTTTLYDIAGKKIGGDLPCVLVVGSSDDGKTVLAVGNPDKLDGPLQPIPAAELEKTAKLLVMDGNLKILRTVDAAAGASQDARLSHNGKYLAIREQVPSTQPTMPRYSAVSVVPTSGEGGARRRTSVSLAPIVQVSDTGDLLGIERQRMESGTLARWNQEGQKVTLLEGVRNAVVQGDTLYYILADQPQTLKAVKLSKLK